MNAALTSTHWWSPRATTTNENLSSEPTSTTSEPEPCSSVSFVVPLARCSLYCRCQCTPPQSDACHHHLRWGGADCFPSTSDTNGPLELSQKPSWDSQRHVESHKAFSSPVFWNSSKSIWFPLLPFVVAIALSFGSEIHYACIFPPIWMKQNKNMDTTVRPTVKKISEVMQNACKVQRICRVHAQQNMLTPTYRLGGGHVFCTRTGLDEHEDRPWRT